MNVRTNDNVVLTDEVREAIGATGIAIRGSIPLDCIRLGVNPRKTRGLDAESMSDLEDTIAADGLLKNILVRKVGDEYQVVAGERRTRAIRSLVEKDILVRDQSTGLMSPASEVYVTVPALIREGCNNDYATRLAFIENDQHEPLCDADTIDLCEDLIETKTRKEVCDLLGKSQAWLSHTLGFRQRLDPANYELLRDGEINRSVAVRLMEYPAEDQIPIIQEAMSIADERHTAVQFRAEEELADAIAMMDEAFVETMEEIDPRAARAAEQRVRASGSKVARAVRRKIQVDDANPTPSQSDVAEAAYRVTGTTHGNKGLTPPQIREHFTDRAVVLLIDADGQDPIDVKTGNRFPARDLQLVVIVAEAIAVGNRDLDAILRAFCRETVTWVGGTDEIVEIVEIEEDEELGEELEESESRFIEDFDFDAPSEKTASLAVRFPKFDIATIGDDEDY